MGLFLCLLIAKVWQKTQKPIKAVLRLIQAFYLVYGALLYPTPTTPALGHPRASFFQQPLKIQWVAPVGRQNPGTNRSFPGIYIFSWIKCKNGLHKYVYLLYLPHTQLMKGSTMKIENINKPILKKFRQDFNELILWRIKDATQLDNVTFELGNASYSDGEATFKLTMRVDGAKTKGQKDLEFWSKLEGVDPNKEHDLYELVEFNSKGRTYPWIYKKKGSETLYKATTQWAKANFPMEAK